MKAILHYHDELLTCPDRITAEAVAEYLRLEGYKAASQGIELVDRPWECVLMIPSQLFSFEDSIRACCLAAQVFMKGFHRGRVPLLRQWRGTLTTSSVGDILPCSWDDPIGREGGLVCQRVGMDSRGSLYIWSWAHDENGFHLGWNAVWHHSYLKTLLNDPKRLPTPESTLSKRLTG